LDDALCDDIRDYVSEVRDSARFGGLEMASVPRQRKILSIGADVPRAVSASTISMTKRYVTF
jgi:hypothetical protein